MSGCVNISGNTYSDASNDYFVKTPINVVGVLKDGDNMAHIGLKWGSTYTVATSGWREYNDADTKVSDCFFSDSALYELIEAETPSSSEIVMRESLVQTFGSKQGTLTFGDTSSKCTYTIVTKYANGTSKVIPIEQLGQNTTFQQYINDEWTALTDFVCTFNTSTTRLEISIRDTCSACTHTIRAIYAVPSVINDTTFTLGSYASTEIELEVNKANASFTAPTAKTDLRYTGMDQVLIDPATNIVGCTVLYSIDNVDWSEDMPVAKDVGDHYVFYKGIGDSNHNDVALKSVLVRIEKGQLSWPISQPTTVSYTGGQITDAFADTETYTVKTHATGTDVGSYNGTLTVRDVDHYVWENGSANMSGTMLVIEKAAWTGKTSVDYEILTNTCGVTDPYLTATDIFGNDAPAGFTIKSVKSLYDDSLPYDPVTRTGECQFLSFNFGTALHPWYTKTVETNDRFTQHAVFNVSFTNYQDIELGIIFSTTRVAYFNPSTSDCTLFMTKDEIIDYMLNDPGWEYSWFKYNGAVFAGWYTDPNFGTKLASLDDAENRDYYAHWTLDGKKILTAELLLDSTTESFDAGTVKWDLAKRTLTLDGACLWTVFSIEEASINFGRLDDATVILADGSTNVIEGYNAMCGIGSYCPLTIKGAGTLNISSNYVGISSSEYPLSIQSGNIHIIGLVGLATYDDVNCSSDISIGGNVRLQLYGRSGNSTIGISAFGNVNITESGSVLIEKMDNGGRSSAGLEVYGNLTVAGSLTLDGLLDMGYYVCEGQENTGKVIVSGRLTATFAGDEMASMGPLFVTGTFEVLSGTAVVDCYSLHVTDGGTLTNMADVGSNAAVSVYDTMELNGGTLTIGGPDSTENGGLSVGKGSVIIDSTIAVYCQYNYFAIGCGSDSGYQNVIRNSTVNAFGNWFGIYAGGTLTIDGSNVTVQGINRGISAYNLVVTSDSTFITVYGETGIYTTNGMTVEGGTIRNHGLSQIYLDSGSLVIRGGNIYAVPDTAYVDDMMVNGSTTYTHNGVMATRIVMTGGSLYAVSYGYEGEYTSSITCCDLDVTGGTITADAVNIHTTGTFLSEIFVEEDLFVKNATITLVKGGSLLNDFSNMVFGEDGGYATFVNFGYDDNGNPTKLDENPEQHEFTYYELFGWDERYDAVISFHQHAWTFQASGTDTIVGTCSNTSGCPEGNSVSITISAPEGDLVCYGIPYPAVLSRQHVYGAEISLTYEYKSAAGGQYAPIDTVPTDPGFYRATVTVGNASASVEYRIYQSVSVELLVDDIEYDGKQQAVTVADNLVIDPNDVIIRYVSDSGYDSNIAPVNAGHYVATASMPDDSTYLITYGGTIEFEIYKRTVTITGIAADDKEYDGSRVTTISGTPALDRLVEGDDVTILMGIAKFDSSEVGNGKDVYFSEFLLTGPDASNYILMEPDDTKANITPRGLTITGLGAEDKEYDGTTDATIAGTGVLSGLIEGDFVSFNVGSAAFSDKNAGTGKTVEFSGFELTGVSVGNYVLTAQPASVTADITPISVNISDVAVEASKVYDGTAVANITDNGSLGASILTGDVVTIVAGTAAYYDKNIGTGKVVSFTGFTLGGADAGNYVISAQPASVTADITALEVTITGTTVSNKPYDGTAAATIASNGTIPLAIAGDDVVIVPGTAAFADAALGTGKTVTFTGFTLGGADAGNYVLSAQPDPATADITVRPVTIAGVAVSDKPYDGTTVASITSYGTVVGFVDGETVVVSEGSAAFDNKDVGTGKAVSFSGFVLGGADAGNYVLSAQPVPVAANIDAVTLTATYAGDSVNCKGTPAFTVNVTGFVNGESETLAGFVAPTVSAPVVVGTWTLTPSGGSAPNYVFSYVPGDLVVSHGNMVKHEGTVTYYTCDVCEKSFIDIAGKVEYTPSEGNDVNINKEVIGTEVSDSDAQAVLDSITTVVNDNPDAEVKANFTTEDSEELSVSADIIKQIAEKNVPVVMNTKDADVELPADLLKAIGTSGDLKVSGSIVTDLTEEQKRYITEGTVVVDVNLSVNGQAWTQFGDKGIKVILPYKLKAGETADSIRIVCLSGSEPEYFDATYDPTTETASFYTTHCSLFAVVPAAADSGPSGGGLGIGAIIGIVVAVIAVAAVVAVVVMKKARKARSAE